MKLIKNSGSDRVIDELRQTLAPPSSLDLASPAFSLFAFAELRDLLEKLDACRVVIPAADGAELGLTGSDTDRAFRNRLQLRWLARECAAWIKKKVELRGAPALLPQYYAQELFEQEELTGYLKNMLAATRSVYEHVVYVPGQVGHFALVMTVDTSGRLATTWTRCFRGRGAHQHRNRAAIRQN